MITQQKSNNIKALDVIINFCREEHTSPVEIFTDTLSPNSTTVVFSNGELVQFPKLKCGSSEPGSYEIYDILKYYGIPDDDASKIFSQNIDYISYNPT